VDEMLQDATLGGQLREDCELLRAQLAQCKSTLNTLTRTAEVSSLEQTRRQTLGEFVKSTVERWAVRRPGAIYTISPGEAGPAAVIEYDSTLCQALENLLNNAADTDTERVDVSYQCTAKEARITIRDRGPGISSELLLDMGRPIIRASRKGLGIGLLLSHATVERCGGRIELLNAEGGGTEANLYLPLVGKSADE